MARVSITVCRLAVLLHFADRSCLGKMQSRILVFLRAYLKTFLWYEKKRILQVIVKSSQKRRRLPLDCQRGLRVLLVRCVWCDGYGLR
jgi:hypothetical protein